MNSHNARIVNVGLRLASLIAKLAVTLYMGKYLSLSDIGIYGLAFGAVMTANCVMGLRIDYTVSREIVGASPHEALHKMRDQAVFYLLNYVFIVIAALAFCYANPSAIDGKITFYIVALTIAESFGNMTATNMNSLAQQVWSNLLFFARSGLWAFPVLTLGILVPSLRSVDFILASWLAGVCISIAATFWIWRYLPWRDVVTRPIDWAWIWHSIRKCFLLWLGALGLIGGSYIDRFITGHYLGLEKVGIATFYLSFTNALLTLIQSGVLSFSYPKLIALHRSGDKVGFRQETKSMIWHVALFSLALAVGMGVAVPLIGQLFHRTEFVENTFVFWLMLVGVCIRANAESLYNILFARHQDRAIWLGNLLFLLPAFGGNMILVPWLGFAGIGYAAIIAGFFLLAWRWWFAKYSAL